MTRTKHLLIIGGILAVAMLLNVTCCRWAIHSEVAGYQAPILAFRHGTGQTVAPGNVAGVWTGVLARPPLSTLTASLLGVVLPVALVFTSAALWVHLRQVRMGIHGQCRECGHALAGATICPECGVEA